MKKLTVSGAALYASNIFAQSVQIPAQAASSVNPAPHSDVSFVPLFQTLLPSILVFAIVIGFLIRYSEFFKKHSVLAWFSTWSLSLLSLWGYTCYIEHAAGMGPSLGVILFKNAVGVFGAVGLILGIPFVLGFSIGWMLNIILQKKQGTN